MREMSLWSVAASLFCSISLFTSATEVATRFTMAGAGNPAAVEQGLSGLVSRMGGGSVAVPQVMAEAGGKVVAFNASKAAAARLERQKKWILNEGDNSTLAPDLAGLFGLTDGKTGYPIKGIKWDDDNDKTQHYCEVTMGDKPYMIIAYKPADNSYAINWLTDVNGKIYRTLYTDATGVRTVPNEVHSAQFTAQIAYWDAITPPGTSVASNASGR